MSVCLRLLTALALLVALVGGVASSATVEVTAASTFVQLATLVPGVC